MIIDIRGRDTMKSYNEALDWIHSLLPHGIKPGLARMEWMLARLKHPERRLKYIHVGGTNGKGSTVSFLRHMLVEGGLEVGTFTSPYIERFNERIAINGVPISDEDFLTVANKVRPLVEELSETELGTPTEFEVITTIALVYFGTIAYPDVVIMEVGLGGTYDSTNVIAPMVTLITNIGHDHTHILGETKREIAKNKAGLIKSGIPVITTEEDEEILQMFAETAEGKRTKIYTLHQQFGYEQYLNEGEKQQFTFYSEFERLENLTITMQGEHQVKNATLALMALSYLKTFFALIIEEEELRRGLEKTFWVGRFEKVRDKPLIYLDGAHNPEGIQALAKTLQQNFANKKIHVLYAQTKEKDVNEMLAPLYPIIGEICFTTFDFQRAQAVDELYDAANFVNKSKTENWQEALENKLNTLTEDDLYIITGSLYFISEVRGYFKK